MSALMWLGRHKRFCLWLPVMWLLFMSLVNLALWLWADTETLAPAIGTFAGILVALPFVVVFTRLLKVLDQQAALDARQGALDRKAEERG